MTETTPQSRVITFCHNKGVKLARLEKDCGFSNGYIRNVRGNIPAKRVRIIADYLGVDKSDIDPDNFPKEEKEEKNDSIRELLRYVYDLSEDDLTVLTAQAKRLYTYAKKVEEMRNETDSNIPESIE